MGPDERGAGATHVVEFLNLSHLDYKITVEGKCVNGGLLYDHNGQKSNLWNPPTHTLDDEDPPYRGITGRFDLKARLVAVSKSDSEAVDTTVTWSGIGHGSRSQHPELLTIYVKSHPRHAR